MKDHNQPTELEKWLQTATDRLIPSAKERIRAEVENHYSEAVAAHQVNGISEIISQAMALEDLGDARNANRQFRKRYLMNWEAKHLHWLLDKKRGLTFLGLNYLFFAIWAIGGIDQICIWWGEPSFRAVCSEQALRLSLLFIFVAVFPTLTFLETRKSVSKRRPRLIILLESCGGYYVGLLLVIAFDLHHDSLLYWLALTCGVFACLINPWMGLRIWNKVQRA